MSQIFPKELRYTKTHEWARLEENNTVMVGITDHAQRQLGDLVFVELPKLNRQVEIGEEIAVVESVKIAADVYSPIKGTVIAVNESLQNTPGSVNADPYGTGWLFRLKILDSNELKKLLNDTEYQSLVESAER